MQGLVVMATCRECTFHFIDGIVWANQRCTCPRVSRVRLLIHGGNLGAFDLAHVFLDDINWVIGVIGVTQR